MATSSADNEAAYLAARHRLALAIQELINAAEAAKVNQRGQAQAVAEEFQTITGLDLNELV